MPGDSQGEGCDRLDKRRKRGKKRAKNVREVQKRASWKARKLGGRLKT